MLWVFMLIISIVVLGVLIEPFLRRGKPVDALEEEDYLAAQVADIARDREAGLISAAEANVAEKEARRRLLAAHRASEKKHVKKMGRQALRAAAGLSALAPLAAFAIYGWIGNPSQTETPEGQEIAARMRAQMAADMSPDERATMIQGMVEGLAARLDQNPDDLEGWIMLARSYGVLEAYEKSAEAYGQAISLSPDNADLHVARIQALIAARGEAGALIDPQTEEAVQMLAALDGAHPFALYFQGVAAAQKGDAKAARDYWSRLVTQMPEDAPERARLVEMIEAL